MRLAIFISTALFAITALAADFHWKIRVGSSSEFSSLGDGEHKAKAGAWKCTTEAVSKGPTKGRESRSVRCEYSADVAVSITAACSDRIDFDMAEASLESKTAITAVAISCSK